MEPLRIISLGWGIQSWTLAAMAALGEIPAVDAAIHADTTHEAAHTYAHAKKWTPWLQERGVKVYTVRGTNTSVVDENRSHSLQIPAFTLDRRGSAGQIRRQCTGYWKIEPINKFIREKLLKVKRPKPGSMLSIQGISWDEAHRMATSKLKWVINDYPLVERRMTRADCVQWLQAHGLDVPGKSACTFCPYHNIKMWKELKRAGGEDWDEAIKADEEIRYQRQIAAGLLSYVHPYRKPLAEAVSIPEDVGAHQMGFEDMTIETGMCESGHCWV